jgi:hypothetical protein
LIRCRQVFQKPLLTAAKDAWTGACEKVTAVLRASSCCELSANTAKSVASCVKLLIGSKDGLCGEVLGAKSIIPVSDSPQAKDVVGTFMVSTWLTVFHNAAPLGILTLYPNRLRPQRLHTAAAAHCAFLCTKTTACTQRRVHWQARA